MNKKIQWILPVCLCMFCACAKEEQVRQEPASGKETIETEYSADGGDLLEEEKYMLYVESMDDMRIDAEPPEGFYVTSTGGSQNVYRIDEDGILWGSGENQYGQLGQRRSDDVFHEEMCRIAGNVVHVDTSQSGFTIYLTEEHELYGMGSDASGVLLSNTTPPSGDLQEWEDTIVTSPVLLMEDVVYARCGRDDVAVLKEDGSLWTWGVAWAVSGAKYCRSAPVRLMENVTFVTGGFYHHAALKEDGSLWTWGYNYTGNCGTDENIYIETPIRVADDVEMVWTGQISYSVSCEKITDFEGTQPGQYENTIIKKNDGSFWACGKDLGNQTGKLEEYYEAADYETTYMAEFVPVELVTR